MSLFVLIMRNIETENFVIIFSDDFIDSGGFFFGIFLNFYVQISQNTWRNKMPLCL